MQILFKEHCKKYKKFLTSKILLIALQEMLLFIRSKNNNICQVLKIINIRINNHDNLT